MFQFGAWYKGVWSEQRCVHLVSDIEGGKPTCWLGCYIRVTASGATESFWVCSIFYFFRCTCISWFELNRVPPGSSLFLWGLSPIYSKEKRKKKKERERERRYMIFLRIRLAARAYWLYIYFTFFCWYMYLWVMWSLDINLHWWLINNICICCTYIESFVRCFTIQIGD